MNKKTNCHSELVSESIKNKEYHTAGFRIKSGMTGYGETGRSMVEMLGVLAVIGVLSVAGIAGYSMAMRNHRANEVLNAASMLYVIAMAKNQGTGADTNYTELGTAPSGTSLAYTASDKKITITFTNEDDCKQAKNKLGDKAPNDCTPASAPATGYNLTINFGETTASTPVVDLSGISSEAECEAAGEEYYWMNADMGCRDDVTVKDGMCHHSEDEAKSLCEAVGEGCHVYGGGICGWG